MKKFVVFLVLAAFIETACNTPTPPDAPKAENFSLPAREPPPAGMADSVRPYIIKHGLVFGGLVETGFPNRLLTLNSRNEFCYLNLETPEKPRLEVITPGFPAKDGWGGELGSDAENRVAWCVRGRGVYFIDLDTKKTGEVHTGIYGDVKHVLLADKEKLLFTIIVHSYQVCLVHVYDLIQNIHYDLKESNKQRGRISAIDIATFNTLGRNRLLFDQIIKDMPQYTGWHLTDTFFTNILGKEVGTVFPGGDPITKALTDKKVRASNEKYEKVLHQGKRLMYAWTRIEKTITQVLVRWSEDLQDVNIYPIPLMKDTDKVFHIGPSQISADGNWLQEIRADHSEGFQKTERIMCHLQDYYPGGISPPVSLGYTTEDPIAAFMNHSKLGPCYVEQNTNRNAILFIFKLNDVIEIIKKQALGAVSKLTQK